MQPKLRLGPSPLSRADELRRQQRQLHHRRTLDATNERLYAERCTDIFRRRLQQSHGAFGACDDSISPTKRGRAAQAAITALVHPAARGLPSRAATLATSQSLIERGLQEGWAQRTSFWAQDEGAALLDGLLVAKTRLRDRPHLVLVTGPHAAYESAVPTAKALADAFDIVVVLHNSRGVGRSVGRQLSLEQAVDDCKAVLRAVRQQGYTQLATYGVGLGAPLLFRALQQLGAAGELQAGDVDVAASIGAPASVPHRVGAYVGQYGARACRWLLQRANVPALDMTELLSAPVLAAHLLLSDAACPRGSRRNAQLVTALDLRPGECVLASGQRAMVVLHADGAKPLRCMQDEHDPVIAQWAKRARAKGRPFFSPHAPALPA